MKREEAAVRRTDGGLWDAGCWGMVSQWHKDVTGYCVYDHLILLRQLYEIMMNYMLLPDSPVCSVLLDSQVLDAQ